jgi:hypothetical protein
MVEPPGKRKWIALPEAADLPHVDQAQAVAGGIAGDIRWRFHPKGVPTEPVTPDQLARANIDWSRSRIEAKAPPFFAGRVEVNRQDLLDYFGSADPPRNRGGRPVKWPWEAFWLEVLTIVHGEGLPEIQEDLVKRMQQWFVDTHGDHPSDSQVRGRISKLYQRLRGI